MNPLPNCMSCYGRGFLCPPDPEDMCETPCDCLQRDEPVAESPNFVPPALVALASRGYQRINVVNEPWNDGTTRPKPLGPAELRACWCFECLDAPEHGFNNPTMQRMILCPSCGNKRCPRATDHRLACTGSNDAGQWGSRYGERVSTSAPPKEGA